MTENIKEAFGKIHGDKQLVINTEGWFDVTCDKCKTVTSFEPTVEFKDMFCLECAGSAAPGIN